ncbi:glycosyltransferase [Actinacidiphila acidipaludis]|uniref:glycosyltransferase n=1 Tax=Actinacidiphila acidipaludis TaxID=2873382 RepID=UPI00223AEB10|nr:glycosyltransferase [Streptomyces acidipaludis]
MIVKNESAVIGRCLAAARGLIDYWVISDTGSTDGTQDLIRQALDGIPGELHEEPWVDFGHNRSLNLRHARGRADYLLLLDADLELRQDAALPPLTREAYMLRHEGVTEYRIKRLVRGDLPWRYEGVTHEYLTCDRTDDQASLDALVIVDHADGGSKHDKFERDERLLRAEFARDPGNGRTVFYLAQTLRDMGRTAESVELYERRAAMGGWPEEVYFALYQSGVLRARAASAASVDAVDAVDATASPEPGPKVAVPHQGAANGGSGGTVDLTWPAAMDALIRAWDARPQRLEACYELTSRLRVAGRYHAAHVFARAGLTAARSGLPDDLLFVQPWIYRYGLLFEFSITAYWTGDFAASLRACDELLARKDLPAAYREQTLANREFALAKLPRRPSARSRSAKVITTRGGAVVASRANP